MRSGDVVSADNTERLFEPHVEVRPGTHYGYGWATSDSTELGRAVGHGGVGLGGNSEIAYYPDNDLAIIVLSNRARWRLENGAAMDLSLPAREVRDQLVKNLAAGDFSALPEPTGARRSWIIPVSIGLLGLALIAFVVIRRRRR